MGYRLTLSDIAYILDGFYGGWSLREISTNFRRRFHLPISPSTILRRTAYWIKTMDEAVAYFVETGKPVRIHGRKKQLGFKLHFGDFWEIDEIYLSVKDTNLPLIVVRDLKTAFIIVAVLAETATYKAIKQALVFAKASARKYPAEIRGDGYPAYPRAVRAVFRGRTDFALHKRVGRMGMNQSIEGTFSTLRSWLKKRRGLHSMNLSPIIVKGLILYHNFVRVSEVLGGKTPAEVTLHWQPIDPTVGGWYFLLGLAKYYKRTVLSCKNQNKDCDDGYQFSLASFLV